MIGAFDTNIQMPVMDLYNTLMMLAAQLAAKDRYVDALKRIDDFASKYGDFMSPFAEDMAEYGRMVGGVQDAINQMYAAGIDPLRSPEARSLISRLSNSVSPAKYNMMRSNAKIGYSYLEAMQKLRLLGKYSEAQELWDIMQSSGVPFNNFSTVDPKTGQLRTWNRTSPIEAVTLTDLARNNYANLTERDLSLEELKNAGYNVDPKWRYTGILPKDLLDIAEGASMSLASDPRAAFFRNEARKKIENSGFWDKNTDPEGFENAVEAQWLLDIANASRWALKGPKKIVDEYLYADYESNLKDWLDSLKLNRDYTYNNLLKHDYNGDGQIDETEMAIGINTALGNIKQLGGAIYNPETGQWEVDDNSPMTWMDKVNITHLLNTADKLVSGNYGMNFVQNIKNIADFYNKRANDILQNVKSQPVKTETIEYEVPTGFTKNAALDYGAYSNTATSYVAPNYMALTDKSEVPTTLKHTRKIKYVNVKDNKEYQTAKATATKWNKLLEDFQTIGKYSKESNEYKNAMKNILDSGLLDQQGFPTGKFMKEIYTIKNPGRKGVVTNKELNEMANEWYSMFETKTQAPAGSLTSTNLRKILGSSQEKEKIPGLEEKYYTVSLKNVKYTPVHRANISGTGRYRYGSIELQFARWMANTAEKGFMLDERSMSALVPIKGSNRMLLEAFNDVTISQRQFDKFYDSIKWYTKGGYSKHLTKLEVATLLGLNPVSLNSKLNVSDGKINKESQEITYYNVPVTGMHDPLNTQVTNEYNDQYNKEIFGASSAYKNVMNSENQSFQNVR